MSRDLFKLESDFAPAGDQPKAIAALIDGIKKGMRYQTLLGVTGSGKTFTVANVIEAIQKPTLVIAHNKTLAAQLAQEYRDFFPNNAVHYFVSYYDYYQPEAYVVVSDTYIEKEAQINAEIERLRHASTQALLTRKDVIIVASVSCIYGLGSPEEYQKVHLKITEVPIEYSVRKGQSKLNSFSDGWRHVSLILAHSSTKQFMLPGLLCLFIGIIITCLLASGPLKIGSLHFDYHYMMAASLTAILSFQILSFLFLTKTFLAKKHFSPQDSLFYLIHRFISSYGIKSSIMSMGIGFLLGISIIYTWVETHFGELNKVRTGLLCFTFLIIGLQLLFTALFLKMIGSTSER